MSHLSRRGLSSRHPARSTAQAITAHTRLLATALLSSLLLMSYVAAAAQAAPQPQRDAVASAASAAPAAPAAAGPANYCNYNVSTQSGRCFYSEQELLHYNATQATITYIAVYNWINYNLGGGYKTFGGNTVCTAAFDNEGKNLPDMRNMLYTMPNGGGVGPSLSDTISSVVTYDSSGCAVNLFDGLNYAGATSGWLFDTPHLGTVGFYDRAASLRIS